MRCLLLLVTLFLSSPVFCQSLEANYFFTDAGMALAANGRKPDLPGNFTTMSYFPVPGDSVVCKLTRKGTISTLIVGRSITIAGGGLFYYGANIRFFGLISAGVLYLTAGVVVAIVGGITYLVEIAHPPTDHADHKHKWYVSLTGSGNTAGLAFNF